MSTAGPGPAFDREYPKQLRECEADLIATRRQSTQAANARGGDLAAAIGTPNDDRVGLAFSGGGIRSATFCLGVSQALARLGLLRNVDLMATVSGGGYFGAAWGALVQRVTNKGTASGVEAAESELSDLESPFVRHLRNSGRYINPSHRRDSWLALGMFLRNWVSLLVVLWVLCFGALVVLVGLRYALLVSAQDGAILGSTAAAGWVVALEAALAERPLLRLWWSPWLTLPAASFLLFVLPTATGYWFTQTTWSTWLRKWGFVGGWVRQVHRRIVYVTGLAVIIVAFWVFLFGPERGFADDAGRWVAVLVVFEAALGLAAFLYARWAHRGHKHHYGERNWLARRLSQGLILTLGLLAFCLMDAVGQTLWAGRAYLASTDAPAGVLPVLGGLLGLAGIAAFGQRIAQALQRIPQLKALRVPASVTAAVAGVALVALFLGSVSYAAHTLVWDGQEAAIATAPGASVFVRPGAVLADTVGTDAALASLRVDTADPESVWSAGAQRPQPRAAMIIAGFALVFSWLVGQAYPFFNTSSLHSFYSARLARAYVGASNKKRHAANAGGIGTPVEGDDLDWDRYRPWEAGGPLHVIVQTINGTTGGKNQIEYRDRKGKILAVGPAGLSAGAHDHALWMKEDGHGAADGGVEERNRTFERELAAYLSPVEPVFHRDATGKECNERHAFGVPRSGTYRGLRPRVEQRTLARNMAISGAAFTTGVGSRTQLGTSLIAGFFNVRLGYWWSVYVDRGTAPKPHHTTHRFSLGRWIDIVFPVQSRFIMEFVARFPGTDSPRWYLSDGGHFENSAAYELIRRRVPFIIVCDCGQDAGYRFADLAHLTRQVRVDFGAEVHVLGPDELDELDVEGTPFGMPETFAEAVANDGGKPLQRTEHLALLLRVDYPQPETPPSYVVWVKPGMRGNEPHDVLHYQRTHEAFPQETTLDQDFDEAQWEAYRKLGDHMGTALFSPPLRNHGWSPSHMRAPGR